MIPVLVETVATCAMCGEVASEDDLLYVETEEEADILGVRVGSIVCRDCGAEIED